MDQDADAAAALTEQLRSDSAESNGHVDVELAARWLQSIRPRTRYDAAPMLTLAKALLQAMCTSSIKQIVGTVEDALTGYREQTAQLLSQNKQLGSTNTRLKECLASIAEQRARNLELEQELRKSEDRFKQSEAAAVATKQAHAAEIDDLKVRLQNQSKSFTLVQNELTRLMKEHQVLAEHDQAADSSPNDHPDKMGSAASATWTAGADYAARAVSHSTAERGQSVQLEDLEMCSEEVLVRTKVPKTPSNGAVHNAAPNGEQGGNLETTTPANGPVHNATPEREHNGKLQDAETQSSTVTSIRDKEVELATDDVLEELKRSLETAQTEVALYQAQAEAATNELARYQADARKAERKHKVALSMVRASMAEAFARAAQDTAEGQGELEQTRAALATKDSAIHVLQNKLHDAIAQNEEQAEQMDELFDMYNGLRQQRTLELKALEEELQRLGLTLELPPPKPPKKGAWMVKKISEEPYNVLLSGQFKIVLR